MSSTTTTCPNLLQELRRLRRGEVATESITFTCLVFRKECALHEEAKVQQEGEKERVINQHLV